ncbi:MAG: right-handed parallel beta-helix repeat-containing protein [Planctomycetota bacterium]|jgi:parallel beta-helix repeat protein
MQSPNRRSALALCLLLIFLAAFETISAAGITKFIPADNSIGTWDPATRTYTLWADVDETIQIDEDDLILNGAGHSVLGAGSGCGLYLHERTAVTVRNLYIEGFSFGIHLHNSSGNIIEQNNISGNSRYGIYLQNSNGNTLIQNTTSDNHEGIFLRDSSSNDLTSNTASKNYSGIYLYNDCVGNVLTGNTTKKNSHGIYLYNSTDNTLTGNTAGSNDYYGIYLQSNCNNNILTDNTVSWNHNCGIYLNNSSGNTITDNTASNNYPGIYFYYNCNNNALARNTISNNYYGIYFNYNCNNNEVYRNNIIDNGTQVLIHSSSENIFSFPAPTGGNYWSDWTTPNTDGDAFIDDPYLFTPTQDDLPWVRQNAWTNQSPTADAGPGQTVHPRDVVTLDGSLSSDPEADYPLTYSWQFSSKPQVSTALLAGADTVSPSFTVDALGDYIIELIVTEHRSPGRDRYIQCRSHSRCRTRPEHNRNRYNRRA